MDRIEDTNYNVQNICQYKFLWFETYFYNKKIKTIPDVIYQEPQKYFGVSNKN